MIVGHKKQIEVIEKALISDKLSHSLLFTGVSGLGKKAIVKHLFSSLNCLEKNSCGKCSSCLMLERNEHPDFLLIQALEGEIKIKQAREVLKKSSLRPYSALFKFIVIDNAHLMNQEAANALLKILEEPPQDTFFFLITEHPELIIDTIKSRTQRIKFFPLTEQEIVSFLEKKGASQEKAQEIAGFSFGRPGTALNFFLDFSKINWRKKKIKELADVLKKDFSFKLGYAKTISEKPEELREILEVWQSYLRVLLLEKSKKRNVNYSFIKIRKNLESIQETIFLITKTNVNPKTALETLFIEL
jgi:DNA polymerase III subunit delta'